MKKLFCMAALTAALGMCAVQSARADQQGNVNFTGTVTANTCTISGQDITHDAGAFNLNDEWAKERYGFMKQWNDVISVSGCPTGMTKVFVTPTFEQYGPNTLEAVKNNGTAEGVTMNMYTNGTGVGAEYKNNQAQTFTLTAGAVDIPMNSRIQRQLTDAVSVGTMDFSSTFAFTYQ